MSRLMKPLQHFPCARRQAGLSLIELMVSLALGLMILTAVISVFVNANTARSEVERTSRQIENGRYAVELLSDDLRVAGFYGEWDGKALPAVGALGDAEHDPCSTTAAHWAKAMHFHVRGYDNGGGAPGCVPASLKAGTDILVVRRARTCVAGVGGCPAAAAGTPYLQVSQCEGQVAVNPFVIGVEGTATYDRQIRDCATNAGKRQYLVHVYFISTDNGSGQAIPSLKMMELNYGAALEMKERPLVEGIEHFHVEYGIDEDGDGSIEGYTADPTTYTGLPVGSNSCGTCTPVTNWKNVVAVQFYILARNIDTSPGYTDNKTYRLGRDAAGAPIVVGPFPDGYRRHIYTGTVRIANAAGRRDKP